MNRRKLLKAAGAAVATGAIAAPAIAQSTPAVRWHLTTSFPKTLDTLYGACEMFAKAIADLSDQKFQISVYDSTIAFRNEQYQWHQVCEATYDNYMIRRIRA